MAAEVHEGDVLEVLGATPDATYHGCLTDPPYGLSFMGHGWDHGVPSADVWREVLRVMKPGAYLLAFGGTRTFHRLVCAIEDAGFEVRDVIAWMYGSGFPKSHDVSKAIDREAGAVREVVGKRTFTGKAAQDWREKGGDTFNAAAPSSAGCVKSAAITAPATEAARQWAGYGTALKPAYEPILVARKPLEGTVAANCQEHGCGALAIDACRIATDWSERSEAWKRSGHSAKPGADKIAAPPGIGINCHTLGRWPANVILDEAAASELDEQTGHLQPRGNRGSSMRTPAQRGVAFGAIGAAGCGVEFCYGDHGGASRFFRVCERDVEDLASSRFIYTAKASRAERNAGCEALPYRWEPGDEPRSNRSGETRPIHGTNSTSGNTTANRGNIHPTVKPLALTRYLARLILPPVEGARLLTPFCGSGSEMIGALQAGWAHVEGIDSWDVAVRIARARIAHHIAVQQMELAHGRA